MSSAKILIADDDEAVIELLSYNLKKEGYEVCPATNGEEAILKAQEFNPDLIILDVMMPKFDGIDVCEKLREIPKFKNTLIIFSSARAEDFTQLSAFNAGADDYIMKPVKPKILLSRIKVMLKRHFDSNSSSSPEDKNIKEADLIINPENFSVTKKGEAINLVKKEFELLSLLISKPGKVFRREEIINQVWGTEVIVGDRTIDVHIRKLREKIGDEYFVTIKGVGYKFNDDLS